MADDKRDALVNVLGKLESLKDSLSSDEDKAKIEDIGDKLIAEFGKQGGIATKQNGCGAAWLYK